MQNATLPFELTLTDVAACEFGWRADLTSRKLHGMQIDEELAKHILMPRPKPQDRSTK